VSVELATLQTLMLPRWSIYYVSPTEYLRNDKSLVEHAKSKLLYNQLAPIFDMAVGRDNEREAGFVQQALNLYVPGKRRVLDIGCGVGRHAEHLGHSFDITGIDVSPEMIRVARLSHQKCQFTQMDMRDIRLESSFDSAICMWTTFNYLSTPADVNAFVSGVHKHLNPGGILIIDIKNYDHEPGYTRIHEVNTPNYNIKLSVHKHLVENLSEGVYIYEIRDVRESTDYFAIDQELNMTYKLEDVVRLTGASFQLIEAFGDYDMNEKFVPARSERIIMILRKRH